MTSTRQAVLEAAHAVGPASRRRYLARFGALLIAALCAMLAIFVAFDGVRLTGRPIELVAGTVTGAVLTAAATGWLAVARGRSVLGRSRAVLIGLLVATPLALLAWKIAWSARFPGALAVWPERLGLRCLRLSLLLGACPLAALVLARRRSDPLHPAITGAALGVAAGASTWVLVDLWCPVAFIPHLLLGHVLPLLLLAVIGALLGHWLIAIRARSRPPSFTQPDD